MEAAVATAAVSHTNGEGALPTSVEDIEAQSLYRLCQELTRQLDMVSTVLEAEQSEHAVTRAQLKQATEEREHYRSACEAATRQLGADRQFVLSAIQDAAQREATIGALKMQLAAATAPEADAAAAAAATAPAGGVRGRGGHPDRSGRGQSGAAASGSIGGGSRRNASKTRVGAPGAAQLRRGTSRAGRPLPVP
eukprot:Rhum_TRINITY_DN11320_c0_g2::Rhum_TRINITY_DN11320_c0_g2_i1::g.43884::m.43884